MPPDPILVLGTDCEAVHGLARCLQAEFAALPEISHPETFEDWRSLTAAGEKRARILIAPWNDSPERGDLMTLDSAGWRARFEMPYLRWNFALGAAAKRVADGGSVVALVQNAAAIDTPGWTPEFAVADGALSLVRSIAASEGPRGVRANLVSTPIGLVSEEVILPRPPLDLFPGELEEEVAGCIRLLLSQDAKGLTGRLLSADGGRSL